MTETCAACYSGFSGWWCDNCDAWPCKCLDHYHDPVWDSRIPGQAFCGTCLVALDTPPGEARHVPTGHH